MTFSTSLGRGLLLQRFGEIVGALAQLVEQPRVLDGDHRLRGEVRHQLDLLVGERPHLLAIDADGADQLVVLEHRHATRSDAAPARRRDASGIALEIGSAGMSAMWTACLVCIDAAEPRRGPGATPARALQILRAAAGRAVSAATLEQLAVVREQIVPNLASQMRAAFSSMAVEHRLQFAGRAG